MSQVAIIGGLVLAMCSSCLSSILMMMGGGDDTSNKTSTDGSESGTTTPTTTTTTTPTTTTPTPTTTTTTTTVPSLPGIRFVRIERPSGTYPGNIINLAEMKVFDTSNTNVAQGKRVSGGPGVHPAGPFERLVDGDATTENFAHTLGDGSPYMEIDLNSPHNIKNVIITNREGQLERTTGMVVKFIRSDGTTAYTTSPVENGKNKMTFDFSGYNWTY